MFAVVFSDRALGRWLVNALVWNIFAPARHENGMQLLLLLCFVCVRANAREHVPCGTYITWYYIICTSA